MQDFTGALHAPRGQRARLGRIACAPGVSARAPGSARARAWPMQARRTHAGSQASSLPYLRRLQVWVYPLVIYRKFNTNEASTLLLSNDCLCGRCLILKYVNEYGGRHRPVGERTSELLLISSRSDRGERVHNRHNRIRFSNLPCY